MPAVPSVQRKMTFSGDYGMDKWVVYKTGSITASGSGGSNTISFSHGLGYTPLIYVQWSETADFNTPREFFQNFGDLYPITEPYVMNASADERIIYIVFQNWLSSSKTLYFRVWGMQPKDINSNVEPTGTISGLSPMVFNGEQNYLKPYLEGRTTVNATNTTRTIDHNLGYIPTIMVWVEDNVAGIPSPVGTVISPPLVPYIYDYFYDNSIQYWTTENALVFRYDGYSTRAWRYKVYLEPIYE